MSETPEPFINKKNLKFEMFPEEITALNREVFFHPKLMQILTDQPNKDVYILLLEIATYCNIPVVAEIYTHKDILELCSELTKALYAKRTQFIIPMA